MANKCPNIHSKEWKDLVNRFGEDVAWALYTKSGDNIPTLHQALDTIRSLNIKYESVNAEEKQSLGIVDDQGNIIKYNRSTKNIAEAKVNSINSNNGNYRAKVITSKDSTFKNPSYEIQVEKYKLPEFKRPNMSAFSIKPEDKIVEDSVSRKPIKGLDGILENWAGKLGFKVEVLDDIKDSEGNIMPAIAKVDMVRKIITVALGKADETTLSEECAHILVKLLGKDNPLHSRLMKVAKNSNTYKKVYASYAEVYDNDEEKIVEETAGKLIAQEVVRLYNENTDDYTKESSSVITAIKKLYDLIKNFFKRRAIEYGMTVDQMNSDMQPFTAVAEMLLNAQTTGLDIKETNFESKDFYYELTPVMISSQEDAEEYLKNISIQYDNVNKVYVKEDGTPVSKRVSDIVARSKGRLVKVSSESDAKDPMSRLRLVKGTTIHAFLEVLMNHKINGASYTKSSIINEVANILSEVEELKDKSLPALKEIAFVTDSQFDNLVKATESSYSDILARQAYIDKQTGTKGEVKIFTERLIYDEQRDLAGTCDLLVVYSNGVIDIYDYKTHEFKEEDNEIVSEISNLTKEGWNVQIVQYKNILTNGIRRMAEAKGKRLDVHFGATRMLPINIQFSIDEDTNKKSIVGFRKIEPWSLEINSLNPVSLDEEMPLNPKLAKALDKLYQTANAQKSKYNKSKSAIDRDAWEKTNDLIQHILVHKDYSYLFVDIKEMYESLERRLTIPSGVTGSLTASEILELKQRADTYYEFLKDAINIIGNSNTEKATMALSTSIATLLKIQNILSTKPVDMILEATNVDITKPGHHISFWAGLFKKLSDQSHPVFKALSSLVKKSQANIHEDLKLAFDRIKDSTIEVKTWAEKEGMTLQDAFNKIIDLDKGTLINKYSKKFYADREAARNPRTISYNFFTDNYQIERVGNKYRYTGKALEDFNKAEQDWAERLAKAKGTINEERELFRYKAWKYKNDVTKHRKAIINPYNSFIREKYRSDNPLYYSEEFKAIEYTPLRKYYDMYVNFNIEFEHITGRKINTRFIGNVRNDIVDMIFQNGVGAIKDIAAITMDTLELRDESDVLYASKTDTSSLDYEGNPIKHIPIFYMDPLKEGLTSKEVKEIEESLDPDLIKDTEAWNIARNRAIEEYAKKKGLKHKSYDLSKTLMLMAQSVYTYRHMSEIESLAQLLLYQSKTKDSKVITEDNLPNMDKWVGKIRSAFGLSSSDSEILEKYINLYIYGKSMQGSGKPIIIGGKEYSINKLVRKLIQWHAVSTLGFKPILGFRNFAQVKLNSIMTQIEGLYYTHKDVKQGRSLRKKDPLKYYGAISFFHIGNKDIWKENALKLSSNKINKILNMENAFYFLEKTDSYVDDEVLGAMLYSMGYDTAAKKIVRMARNPNAIPIADLIHIDDKNNFTIDMLSEQDIIKFRTAAQSAATTTKGVMPAEDRYLANTTIAGSLVMMYRGWMPGMVAARFKGLQRNEAIDEYDIGRFTVLLKDLSAGGSEITKTFGRLVLRSIPILGYLAGDRIGQNKKAALQQYETYFKEHPEESKLDFSFEDFCNLRIQKLKALGFELQSIIGLFLIAMLAKSLVPDEPDDDVSSWAAKISTQNLYRALYGAYLEASFFVNINSVTDIMSSPFALISHIKNIYGFFSNTADEIRDVIAGDDYKDILFWEKDKRDRTSPFYFTSRLIPGANAVQDFFDIFNTFTYDQR